MTCRTREIEEKEAGGLFEGRQERATREGGKVDGLEENRRTDWRMAR